MYAMRGAAANVEKKEEKKPNHEVWKAACDETHGQHTGEARRAGKTRRAWAGRSAGVQGRARTAHVRVGARRDDAAVAAARVDDGLVLIIDRHGEAAAEDVRPVPAVDALARATQRSRQRSGARGGGGGGARTLPSRAVCRFEISTSSDWISSRETSFSDIGLAALWTQGRAGRCGSVPFPGRI